MAAGVVLDLSAQAALLASVSLSACFVLALHFWRLLGYEEKNRNDEGTIKRRVVSTAAACLVSAALVLGLATPAPEDTQGLTHLELLGLQGEDLLRSCLACLALTAVLFLGPLVQHLLAVAQGYAEMVEVGDTWITVRNLVAAPISEEFVFRACVVRIWDGAGFTEAAIVFGSPVLFALAHAHHFIEHVRNHEDSKVALVQVAFQVFYTSLFGIYATFLLLRTGSTPAVILAHTFCNHQGFPDLGFFQPEGHPLSSWRCLLAILYLVGIVAFATLLYPATAGFRPHYSCMLPGSA